MFTNGWVYAKGSLLGFVAGFFLFLFTRPMLELAYHDQFWLLFACLGSSVIAGCALMLRKNHSEDEEWNRWRTDRESTSTHGSE